VEAAIDIAGVEFGWGRGRPLLRIEGVRVARGERVLLRGPSGSGKSTLLALIGGVLSPQAGTVSVLGKDVARMSAAERDRFRGDHIGFIFQMFNLIPYLTVLENVELPAQFAQGRRKRIQGELRDEALRLLHALGLDEADLLTRRVTELSIGQQQRVAAARALLGSPELIVADEPTAALDTDTRDGFLKLLMSECARCGSAVLVVSHDPALAPLFDRTVAMADINRPLSAAA
jgi:putative ABC transport system ATP-binding protein